MAAVADKTGEPMQRVYYAASSRLVITYSVPDGKGGMVTKTIEFGPIGSLNAPAGYTPVAKDGTVLLTDPQAIEVVERLRDEERRHGNVPSIMTPEEFNEARTPPEVKSEQTRRELSRATELIQTLRAQLAEAQKQGASQGSSVRK